MHIYNYIYDYIYISPRHPLVDKISATGLRRISKGHAANPYSAQAVVTSARSQHGQEQRVEAMVWWRRDF